MSSFVSRYTFIDFESVNMNECPFILFTKSLDVLKLNTGDICVVIFFDTHLDIVDSLHVDTFVFIFFDLNKRLGLE